MTVIVKAVKGLLPAPDLLGLKADFKDYMLIAILEPDAHTQAGSIDIMDGLAKIAEDFRNRF
ncbi:MAG: hypothetical protein GY862_35595 [Gammaproteobacteria bacterium]|nr:hypothetical protein [Gammaproteobacteria bacterium]